MISGIVLPGRADGSGLEARVHVEVAGDNRIFQYLDAVVDTGFNGELTLPADVIQSLGLHGVGRRYVIMGDGRREPVDLYDAVVSWHGRMLHITVELAEIEPLIGTDLLAGCRLAIDWWDGGEVILEERMRSGL